MTRMSPEQVREAQIVGVLQWTGAWAAVLATGDEIDKVDEAFLRQYLPHPNQYFDGPASQADLRKFFIATLQGVLKMLEQVQPKGK